jgi:hypothetical protein
LPQLRPWIVLVSLSLLLPGVPWADRGISFTNMRVHEDWLELDFEFEEGFSDEVAETLERGLPATVVYRIELWRSRSRWFDRLEASRFLTFHVEHDPWIGAYKVRGPAMELRLCPTLTDLADEVLRLEGVRVTLLDRLREGEAHFFALRAEVRPVELEQIREIEAWLEGNLPGEESEKGEGGIWNLPERLFGFVADFAGFGEESIEAKSIIFRPGALR